MQQFKRQTAYRFWIRDIVNARPVANDDVMSYMEVKGRQALRVNVVASVVDKFVSEDKNYAYLTLDDGTDTIRLKCWSEDIQIISNIDIGDVVIVVGKLKERNLEVYINPEIVRVVYDPNLELLRKIELLREHGRPLSQESAAEETVTETARQKILKIVERIEGENGAQIEDIISEAKLPEEQVNSIIQDLLIEGEVYENRPGVVKVI